MSVVRRGSAALEWIAIVFAATALILRIAGAEPATRLEMILRSAVTPAGLVLLAGSFFVRQRSARAADVFVIASIVLLAASVFVLMRGLFGA